MSFFSLFMVWVWIGGVFAMPEKKIGFFERVLWPIMIGEYMHTAAVLTPPPQHDTPKP